MNDLALVIGNKKYSSWSLRAWLLLKQAQIPFREVQLKIRVEPSDIPNYSPSGKVPVLIDGDSKIWESLAIAEYIAEKFPEKQLWPENSAARAFARSICSEMHAGFMNLRKNMPMDCTRLRKESTAINNNKITSEFDDCRTDASGKEISKEVQEDINRICAVWNEARAKFGKAGPFLFGHFNVADAMFAPVAIRFNGYHVKVDATAGDYMKTILALPAMQEWIAAGKSEKEEISF